MEEPRVDPEPPIENFDGKSNSGEDLMSAFATAEIPPDVSDTPQHETHRNDAEDAIADHSESSTSSSRRQSEMEGYLHDTLEIDGQTGAKSASSRSSLSSISDSVLVHPKEQSIYGRDSIGETYEEQEEFAPYGNPVYPQIRDRNSPFRHPSSVKAIQMQTEDEEDEDIMSPSRRKAMFRGSPTSVRSLGSPLLRRHGYHSAGGTPKRSSPVKRENPLVLLHCTVLQPTVLLGPGMSLPDRQILEKVLPPIYWRRWKLLEEKISGSGLLRDRGLLLQHPQEDYGLLEERLLESLELQKPRLENGHFNNHEASDSENEVAEEKSKHSNQEDKGGCVDCGCHVNHRDDRRKWDVKFYAANGLMKEGAWTAAWKEIERVDVQVSLWLPYEVKSEVENRTREEILVAVEMEKMKAAERIMIEPQPSHQNRISQDEIDGLGDGLHDKTKNSPTQETRKPERDIPTFDRPRTRKRNTDPDLHTLIINSIRVLASDRRNIITAISMLIAVLAVIFGGRQTKRTHYGYDVVQFGDFPAVSTQVYHTTSSSVLTQASTEVPICESESRVERAGEVQRVVEGVLDEANLDVVQPVERRQEAETVIEPVEQKTTEIPVDSKLEVIETATSDVAVDGAHTTEPDESNGALLQEIKVNQAVVQETESFETQEDAKANIEADDSAVTQNQDATIKLTEEPTITQHYDHVTAQENDSVATQDDNAAITQIEEPAITDTNSTITQGADSVPAEEYGPAITEKDGRPTPQLDINESA